MVSSIFLLFTDALIKFTLLCLDYKIKTFNYISLNKVTFPSGFLKFYVLCSDDVRKLGKQTTFHNLVVLSMYGVV